MSRMRGLAAVAVAAAVVGAVGSARANEETKQTSHPASGSQGEREPCSGASTSRQSQAQPPALKKEPGGPAIQQVNRQADTLGDRANRALVGDDTQNYNEWAAAHPREAERRESGVAEGRANMQPSEGRKVDVGRKNRPAEGRTNMQPEGRTSMQPGGEPAPAGAGPGGFGGMVRDVTRTVDSPGNYDPFALTLNPLGLFVGGRLSFNAEWAPTVHHALELSPHFVHTSADVATSGSTMTSQAFTGIGGEIGYRYYTGHRGMNGIFVGPSLIAGVYNAGLPSGNQPFTNIGIAGDVGVQDILWNHLVVGAGVGIEYLSVSHDFGDLPTGPSTIASSGFKPRLLLQAGYGF